MTDKDIKRLNYIYYSSFRSFVKNPPRLIDCLRSFLWKLRQLRVQRPKGHCEFKEVLFIAPTLNNRKSLQPIMDYMPIDRYTVWTDWVHDLPYWDIYRRSLYYLHLFLILYLKSNKEDRLLIRYYYWDFMTVCGLYKTMEKKLLLNPQLKMIVMANDHVPRCRVLIELAEKHHINSLYVQHASITDRFPPLRFSYSFLDGKESYEKYKKIGNMHSEVFLSGSPRFDAFHSYKGHGKKYDLGIALNELDSVEKCMKLCQYVQEYYSLSIIVRPHPGMLLNRSGFNEELFTSQGIAVSNPLKELSYIFLSEIKGMVANESGIHLDAALMRVPSVLYNFSDSEEIVDWYSYIANGLVRVCNTPEDVVSQLLEKSVMISDEIIQYYNAAYKAPVEGHIGEMIANYINIMIDKSPEFAKKYILTYMQYNTEYAEYRYDADIMK